MALRRRARSFFLNRPPLPAVTMSMSFSWPLIPLSDFTVAPWLEKNIKKPLSGSEVITGRSVPVVAGDTLPFFGTPFTVVGTLEPTGMKFFDHAVFMSLDAAYEMAANSKTKAMQPITIGRNEISAVLARVKNDYTPDRVAHQDRARHRRR